jgi:hypothetical protein
LAAFAGAAFASIAEVAPVSPLSQGSARGACTGAGGVGFCVSARFRRNSSAKRFAGGWAPAAAGLSAGVGGAGTIGVPTSEVGALTPRAEPVFTATLTGNAPVPAR